MPQNLPSRQDILDGKEDWARLELRKVPKMLGFGVFARAHFACGTLVVRYAGELLSVTEGRCREQIKEEAGFVTLAFDLAYVLLSLSRRLAGFLRLLLLCL